MQRTSAVWFMLLGAAGVCPGQWASYRDPAIPRTKDGKPNLSAPAPRVKGKPDLTGIWQAESAPGNEIQQFLLPGGINGLGEDLPSKYFFNFFADFGMGKEPMQPEAAAAYRKMAGSAAKPPTLCPLPAVPFENILPAPFKIFQTPRATLFLYEADTIFRQVFTDGRALPGDPQPSWLGYSVGKWEGDTFVIQTVGLNDKGTLDAMQHPHSEALKLTERLRRRDFGHLEAETTVDDPKTYTKAVTIKFTYRLLPDTELIETFCNEAEKDLAHFPGN